MVQRGVGMNLVHTTPNSYDLGFICHEMGHQCGLPHSWSANPDFEYGDGWDVMSWQTSTFNFPLNFKGVTGLATVGVNARNLEALGAMPPDRIFSPLRDFSEVICLDPLNQRTRNTSFLPGHEFITPDPKIYMRVIAFDTAQVFATLRIWDLPEKSGS